jgi:AraC-like DNA-binding protein
MLQERGLRAEAVFGRTEDQRQRFADPERVVPLAWLGVAFKSAAESTAVAEFGLMVGLRAGSGLTADSRAHGAQPGLALTNVISRPSTFPDSLLSMRISEDKCSIECKDLPGSLVARDQLTDCAIGFAAGALRALCGPRWRPTICRFAYRQPAASSRHAELLQAPISFDAPATTLEFDLAWLGGDASAVYQQSAPTQSKPRSRRDLAGQIRVLLASWNTIERPSAPSVALELGLKQRTLNRLLSKEGTSFIRLLEDARFEQAQQLLKDSSVPMLSIAWSLGYADASAFSRAFRRWSGKTPTEWRQAEERPPP